MKTIKYLSMFSGIGGFEYGLQQSKNYNFECVGFSEIDKFAKSIYTRWFPRHKDLGDATKIDPKELQDFDLLVGGFPCQAFSLAGHRRGFDESRGTLFFEIARVLKEKKPRYILLENVKGLLSHDKGRTFKTMLGILAELGYDVEWQVYNSKDFGTAQNRERVYIKGYFRAKCGGEILSVRRDGTEVSLQGRKSPIETLVKGHQATRILGTKGTSVTLTGESGGQGGKTGLYAVPSTKPYKFSRQVKKRVHTIDYDELSSFLKNAKKTANVTIDEISEKLGKKRSEVEHWFRTDKYFAPPTDDVWFDLKGLLGIETDTYDAFITEYELVDGVYEMDKRAYDESGLSPTLTSTETLAKVKVVGNYSNTGHKSGDVLDKNGLSRTITSSNYKHPMSIIEKEETPKVKKVYGSTQKHRAETDGTYAPTLTEAMGKGGGHVPMLEMEDEREVDIIGSTSPTGHWGKNVHSEDGLSPTLCGQSLHKNGLRVKTNTKKGYDEVSDGDGVRLCHPSSKKARGRTQKGQTGALSTSSDWGTLDNDFRIRRLTPKECERLQAFPDDWTKYDKDGKTVSDTQRYKCIGNAVTTSVVTWIVDNNLFGENFESN